MELTEFKRIVRRALERIPAELKIYVDECQIIFEPCASAEKRRELEVADDEVLFGLYEGVPLPERHVNDPPSMPPRIYLFYETLLEECDDEDELIHEIQTTVLHEAGHHFGLDEDKLAELGFG